MYLENAIYSGNVYGTFLKKKVIVGVSRHHVKANTSIFKQHLCLQLKHFRNFADK